MNKGYEEWVKAEFEEIHKAQDCFIERMVRNRIEKVIHEIRRLCRFAEWIKKPEMQKVVEELCPQLIELFATKLEGIDKARDEEDLELERNAVYDVLVTLKEFIRDHTPDGMDPEDTENQFLRSLFRYHDQMNRGIHDYRFG